MTFRTSTALTATLLAGLFIAGALIPAHAGDGCGSDKKKGAPTTSLWSPPWSHLGPTHQVRSAWV